VNRHTQKRFHAVAEAMPGEKWLAHYRSALPAYRHWFSIEGELKRPSLTDCRDALHEFMPEFVPLWERLIELADADTNDARLLSFYCPAPYLSGCSQAVWVRYNPTLVRNYDYSPDFCEGRIMRTRWHNTDVIASTDCLWGVLDGMNEHGLAVSLAFGGKEATTEGFGIPIILRYILEFCRNADEATALLCRIPAHMAYNVTILDAEGRVQTVEVAPFSEPVSSSKVPSGPIFPEQRKALPPAGSKPIIPKARGAPVAKVTLPFTGFNAGLAGPEPPHPIIIKIIINQRLLILTSSTRMYHPGFNQGDTK
jgi:predicted choloylglycine hydrolase